MMNEMSVGVFGVTVVFIMTISWTNGQRLSSPWQDLIDQSLTNFKAIDSQEAQSSFYINTPVSTSLPSYRDIIIMLVDKPNVNLVHENHVGLNIQCFTDVISIGNMLKDNTTNNMWLLKLLDASGKPRSGILQGAFTWPGQYKECYDVNVPVNVTFQPQYCSTIISVAGNGSHSSNINFGLSSQIALTLGLCSPSSCNASDIAELVNIALKSYEKDYIKYTNGTLLQAKTGSCTSRTKTYDAKAIIAITIYCIFFLLLILGTAYDVIVYQPTLKMIDEVITENGTSVNSDEDKHVSNKNEYMPINNDIMDMKKAKESYTERQNVFRKVLLAFSVYSNGKKILHAKHGAGQLECLHGIRFLSMSWVIVGHSYFFGIAGLDNIALFGKIASGFAFQVIINATFCVDSFFVLRLV